MVEPVQALFEKHRYVLAFLIGLLQAASFPKFGWYFLAWLVPGLILWLALRQTASKAFRIGYCAGLGHYLLSLYWLLLMPLPIRAIASWLAVSAVLACYTGAWTWICWRLCAGRVNRVLWPLICAAAWVAMEMGITRLFTGFPWNLLGASQYKLLPLIQIASLTGVYGVSFIIVWVSVAVLSAFLKGRGGVSIGAEVSQNKWPRERSCTPSLTALGLPVAAVALAIVFGRNQLARVQPVEHELKIALIQPSIPQVAIWDENERANRFAKLEALSREALTPHGAGGVALPAADLLVWPEAALPNTTRFDALTYRAVTNLVLPNKVWMVLGADDAAPKKNSNGRAEVEFFNGAYLIDPQSQLTAKYYKRHLVMFGEYMPLARWLPFLKYLRATRGGFSSGSGPVPFELPPFKAKISVLICFEDVFPKLVRESVRDDTDFLLNLTNNGWFGESAAQWQHAISALFRAVENGLPLVRCANNGLTCWVDSNGRLHDSYFGGSRDVYGPVFKLVKIPLAASGGSRPLTFYHRHGDWFGWVCVVLAFASPIWVMVRGHLSRTRMNG